MIRIQRRRTKGWRMPEGAVYVGRPTRWGNPFPWKGDWITWTAVALGYRADEQGRREASVALYRCWIAGEPIVARRSPGDSGAAVEYSNGRVATLGQIVQGFAAVASSTVPTPAIPEDPPPLEGLRGATVLACWCRPDQPCHTDALIELGRERGLWA
jgi:hypothetical protein